MYGCLSMFGFLRTKKKKKCNTQYSLMKLSRLKKQFNLKSRGVCCRASLYLDLDL